MGNAMKIITVGVINTIRVNYDRWKQVINLNEVNDHMEDI